MSEAQILPRVRQRSGEAIWSDIRVQNTLLSHLRTLACEYVDLDFRPYFLGPEGLVRIGDEPVPAELRKTITEEAARLRALLLEMIETENGQ